MDKTKKKYIYIDLNDFLDTRHVQTVHKTTQCVSYSSHPFLVNFHLKLLEYM